MMIGERQESHFMRGRIMTLRRAIPSSAFCATLCLTITAASAQQDWRMPQGQVRMYNTAKKKLLEGKKIVGVTISSPDPNIYCAAANSGFDYTWIEMQHSPLTYSDVAKMIWACRAPPPCRLFVCQMPPRVISKKPPTSAPWALSFPR